MTDLELLDKAYEEMTLVIIRNCLQEIHLDPHQKDELLVALKQNLARAKHAKAIMEDALNED